MNIIETLEKEQLRSDIPEFAPGDTVRVHAKIVEGSRERIQMFEGVVIGRQGTGVHGSPHLVRHRCRAHVPGTFPAHREDRRSPQGYCPSCKTLLSAQPYG